MDENTVIDITTSTLEMALKLSLPLLLSALVVGLIVSVFQAVTQIQEMTLSFIPKILAMVVVIVVAGPWMMGQLTTYTKDLYGSIPERVGR
jgi:flagellar biosynthetic protein FliQ